MSTTYTASALPHSGTPLFEVTALTDGVAAVYTICVADGGTEADAIAIAQAKHESPPTAYVVTAAHYSEAIEQHLTLLRSREGIAMRIARRRMWRAAISCGQRSRRRLSSGAMWSGHTPINGWLR